MAITVAPTPIPTRAPVLRLWESEEEGFAVGGMELVFEVEVGVMMEEDGVDGVDAIGSV